MNGLQSLIDRGGPVMNVIIGLSALLYSQCFNLLLTLRRSRRFLKRGLVTRNQLPALQSWQEEMQELFTRQRVMLAAMIAAAPLLGLLGTVSGMARTFESLAIKSGEKSMEGLAGGISQVLVATESGLAVAIPALLLVYLAHREIDKQRLRLNCLKAELLASP